MKHTLFASLAVATFLLPSLGFPAESEAGLMKQAKVTKAQAEEIALAKVPQGKIKSAEIENEHHALVWSFDITTPGSKDITEVLVDAKSGKILSVDTENPAAQAKERAEDKAAAQKH